MSIYTGLKITSLATLVAQLADQPTGDAVALKAVFDAAAIQIKEALNALIDQIDADKDTYDTWKASLESLSSENLVLNFEALLLTHASRHAAGGNDAIAPESIGAEKEHLPFTNQTVSISDWATYTANGTEETAIQNKGFIYRKALTLSGVDDDMTAYIIPSIDKEDCGTNIHEKLILFENGAYIYAEGVPTAAFTLLSINVMKAVG